MAEPNLGSASTRRIRCSNRFMYGGNSSEPRALSNQPRLPADQRGPSLAASTGSISPQGRSGIWHKTGTIISVCECIMMQSLVRILLAQPTRPTFCFAESGGPRTALFFVRVLGAFAGLNSNDVWPNETHAARLLGRALGASISPQGRSGVWRRAGTIIAVCGPVRREPACPPGQEGHACDPSDPWRAILRKQLPQMSPELAAQSYSVLIFPNGLTRKAEFDSRGVQKVLEPAKRVWTAQEGAL